MTTFANVTQRKEEYGPFTIATIHSPTPAALFSPLYLGYSGQTSNYPPLAAWNVNRDFFVSRQKIALSREE